MKLFIQILTISMLMIFVAPAWSAAVLHSVQCQQGDISDEELDVIAKDWLKTARSIKGGENLQLRMNFPVAARVDEVDVVMLIVAPSFAEWGEFMDNYTGSEAEAMDEKHGTKLSCGNGTLWETVVVE